MALVPKIDPNKIFASNAPTQDKPAAFDNYEKGMDETRKNLGRPTIPQLNYLHQTADQKILWIHQNGGGLPYDASIEYAENAVTLKDGELKQLVDGTWVEVKTKALAATDITTTSAQNQQQINDFGGAKWYAKVGGYKLGATVKLENGDIVKSTTPNNTIDPNVDMAGWEPQGNKSVAAPNDLTSIQNPKDGQVVYVASLQKNYIYNSANTYPSNGVTVIGKWEMETQDAYYASWFAKPNVVESQDVALQKGYAYATSKQRPYVIDGVFWMTGRGNVTGLPNGDLAGLLGLSNSQIHFIRGVGELKIIPNSATNYHVIIICNDAHDIVINYPTITGDRKGHTYTAGSTHEWGYGITVYESKDITINQPVCSELTGDGIYIGKAWASQLATLPTNVVVNEPIVHHVRRNGISVTSGNHVRVLNPDISYIGDSDSITGAFPKACIDLEPEEEATSPLAELLDCTISNPHLHDTYAGIFAYAFLEKGAGRRFEVSITGTILARNISNIGVGAYIHPLTKGYLSVDTLEYIGNAYIGISVGVGKSTTFKFNVKQYNFVSGTAINFLSRAQDTNRVLGSTTIQMLTKKVAGNSAFVVFDGLPDYSVDDFRVYCDKNQDYGVTVHTNNSASQANFANSGVYLDSRRSYIHSGWTAASSKMPNEIWQNPSIDTSGLIEIYINAVNDYRLLTVGLYAQTTTVGMGCNIQGLNLLVGGVAKTRACCLTLGGWLKFRNVVGGRTVIYDSYGDWTYS